MKIDKHTVASVTYSLTVEGEHIESADKSNPLVFLVGVQSMIPGFEDQLTGLQAGDTYDILVPAKDGYGEVNDDAIVDLPIDVFKVDGELQEDMMQIGNMIPLQDQDGHTMQGIILDIMDDKVKMDFNHQFAGRDLSFKGEIISVRAATPEEVEHRHVH